MKLELHLLYKTNQWMKTRLALVCALTMLPTAQADVVTGNLWHVAEADSQNAIPANIPATTPDVVFDVSSPFNFSGTSATVADWLASSGAFNIVENTPGTLGSQMDNFSYGTLVRFFGCVTVSDGQTFTLTHDDGLTLVIGGFDLGFNPGPTSPITSTQTYTGPSGTLPFELVYGECCGGPAVLQLDLPLSNTPVARPLCPDTQDAVCNDPGQCGAVVNYVVPTPTDGCGTVTCTPAPGSFFPLGQTTVVCSCSEQGACGCLFVVTVSKCVVTCPPVANDLSITTDGVRPADIFLPVTYPDNYPLTYTIVTNPSHGTLASVYGGLVVYTPDSGYSGFDSFTFKANDGQQDSNIATVSITITPHLPCPADPEPVCRDPDRCATVVLYSLPPPTDACGTVTCTPPAGSFFPVGRTIVNCTCSETGTSGCSFKVTVLDCPSLVLTCPDITVSTDAGTCTAVVRFDPTGGTGSCGTQGYCYPNSGSSFPVGQSIVSCTFFDAFDNSNTCDFRVTVEDNQPPTIDCPADIVTTTAPGRCDQVVSFRPLVTDNCAAASFNIGFSFDDGQTPAGTALNGYASITDDGSGNNNALHLTDAGPIYGQGGFIIEDPGQGKNVRAIHAHWRSLIGGASTGDTQFGRLGGEGYSFNWSTDFDIYYADEEGTSAGLSVTIDTVDNGPFTGLEDAAPGIQIKWRGAQVAFDPLNSDQGLAKDFLRKNQFVSADLSVTSSGLVTFTYDGRTITAQLPDWAGLAGGRFGFGARIGSFYEASTDNHWIDDLSIVHPVDLIVLCTPPSDGTFPLGTTAVNCTTTDTAGNSANCAFLVAVKDSEPPIAHCTPTTNPTGSPNPLSGGVPTATQSSGGFYQLSSRDNCDNDARLYVGDTGSTFVAGPFHSGDVLKLVQAPGVTPKSKPMSNGIAALVELKGDAEVWAVDTAGNVSAVEECHLRLSH